MHFSNINEEATVKFWDRTSVPELVFKSQQEKQALWEELNNFKTKEMESHPESKDNIGLEYQEREEDINKIINKKIQEYNAQEKMKQPVTDIAKYIIRRE